MTITYGYGKNLYVNTTNRCTCACEFCIRTTGDGVGTASSLWLDREPTREEILADIQKQNLSRYDELVFCGYGEPTFRWDDIAWVCDQLRDAGPVPPVRMDTNGHGNVICGRDITPELKGRIDVVSISLNWSDQAGYDKIVHPDFPQAFPEDGDKPLLVEAPYDGLYDLYLMSKVDFYNREADNYNNSALAYNAALDEWRKQYHRRHLPIGGGGLTGLF